MIARLVALVLLVIAPAAAAHPPYGIAADPRENVYFSDLERVWRLGADGKLLLFRRQTPNTHVHELRLTPAGDLIGEENRYDPATETFSTAIWRKRGDGSGNYILPLTNAPPKGSGIWVDEAGNSYTAQWLGNDDRRTILLQRSPTGEVTVLFGDPKAGAAFRQVLASGIGGMTFGTDGTLVFADGPVLRRLGPEFRVETLFEGDRTTSLRGIASGPSSTILAADIGNRRLLSIGRRSAAETLYRSPAGWLPTGVASAAGRLWLLEAEDDPEHRSHRVRVVEIVGSKGKVVAVPGEAQLALTSTPATATRRGTIAWFAIAAGAFVLALGAAYAVRRARTRRPGEQTRHMKRA